MEQSQNKPTPGFYKFMALVFLILAVVFIWAAIRQHSWFYGAFGIITVINALMSTLKSFAARES